MRHTQFEVHGTENGSFARVLVPDVSELVEDEPQFLRYVAAGSIGTKSNSLIGYTICYPDLLEAGAEELVAGLESGAWTSVDLTKARWHDFS